MTLSTINGEFFFDYLRGTLLPQMKPFDGQNPESILDNCSSHHTQEVKDIVQQARILLMFLPVYSPDLNPIEEAFSFVKQYLRQHDELLQAIPDFSSIVQHAFDTISPDHCNSWITHSG